LSEVQIINRILERKSVDIVKRYELDKDFFPGYGEEYEYIMDYYNRYNGVPDVTTFLSKFPDFELLEVGEPDMALIEAIKEARGYSLIAPALQAIDEVARVNSVEAAKLMQDKAKEILQSVSVLRFSTGTDIFGDAMIRGEEYLRRLQLAGKIGCIFGLDQLDKETGGVQEQDFVGVVGRPGQGKSWIAEFLALQPWLYQKKKVGFFSLENSKELVGFRADTLLQHFSNSALVLGRDVTQWTDGRPTKNSDDYFEWIRQAAAYDVPFRVFDNSDSTKGYFTIEDIREIAEANEFDLTFVDQLSLLGPSQRFKDIRQSYIHITRSIRSMVNDLKKPLYLTCQAGREASKLAGKASNNTPELHQIAESDSVGQDATKLLTLKYDEGILKISLKKNTVGRGGIDSLLRWDIDSGYLLPIELDQTKTNTSAF
jgi:replicative DNA helicase